MSAAAESSHGSFLRKAGPLVMARMFTAGLTLLIPLVLARALSLSEYGTYKQLFLLVQSLYLIVPFGMAQSLYFFIPRSEERRPYYFNSFLFLLLGGILAGTFVLLFAGHIARYFSNPELARYRYPLAGCAMTFIASAAFEIGLTSQGKTSQSAIVYLVSDTTRMLSMVVPILLGKGLWGSMIGLMCFTALRMLFAWGVLMSGSRGRLFDRKLFWSQLVYAAPFGAAMLVAIPQQYAHQYAVSFSVSPEMFALYSVGCFQLPIVDLLYTPTSEVLMVRLGELEKAGTMEEGVHAFREACGKLSLAFFPMSAFLFAAAPEFIGALFGQKFLPAVPLFRVSVLGIILAAFPIDGVLRARNETRHVFTAYLVKAIATAPLVFFGVKYLGMMGGIASWATAELIGKIALVVRVPQALSTSRRKLSLVELFPWKNLGKASMAAAAAALSVFALRALAERAWLALPHSFFWRTIPLAVAGGLFAIGYVAVLWISGVRIVSTLSGLLRRRVA